MYTYSSVCNEKQYKLVGVHPQITTIKKGFILPWRSAHEGGVLDFEGKFIDASRHTGAWLNIGGGV